MSLEIKSAVVSEHSDECGKDKQGAAGAVIKRYMVVPYTSCLYTEVWWRSKEDRGVLV